MKSAIAKTALLIGLLVIPAISVGMALADGSNAPPAGTAAGTVPPQVTNAYTIGGGIEVWELTAGTKVDSPNLSPGYGYKWAGGSWVQFLGDVDRLKSLKPPIGALSGLRVARVTRIYIGPVDTATGLRPVTQAIAIGSWLPEQFVGCEQESAEEMRGFAAARLVRANDTYITVLAPGDGTGGLAGGSIEIEARWLACLGRGSMPAVYGPTKENE